MNAFHEKATSSRPPWWPLFACEAVSAARRHASIRTLRRALPLARCMMVSARAGAAFLLTVCLERGPGFHAQSPGPEAIGSFTARP